MRTDTTITVCAACLTAACWKGIFMCENSQSARTTKRSPAELAALGLEHPCYWDGTYERRIEEQLDRGERPRL